MNWVTLYGLLKKKINDAIGLTNQFVDELPSTGDSGVLYFVPKDDPQDPDQYFMYVWDPDASDYVLLDPDMDLSIYAKSADLANVATSGSYTDLTSTPDLSQYLTKVEGDTSYVSYNIYSDKEVTGNPALFYSVSGGRVKKAEATFSPKQDLHGQSAPWPAGGGKNKFGGSVEQGGVYSTGGLQNRTDRCRTTIFEIMAVTTYTASVKSSGNAVILGAYYYNSSSASSSSFIGKNTETGKTLTFTPMTGSTYCLLTFANDTDTSADISPTDVQECMIELGSQATPFAPYSNICPISGWNGLGLGISGSKNHFKTTATSIVKNGITYTVNTDGTIDVSGTPNGSASYMIGTADIRGLRGNIAVSAFAYSSQMCWDSVKVLDSNDTTLYEYTTRDESTVVIDLSQYPTADHLTITVMRFSTNPVSGTLKPQVEIGATRTDFVPYTTPTTHTATFPSTIMGGSYDFVSGEGGEVWKDYVLNDLSWSYSSSSHYFQSEEISGLLVPASSNRKIDGNMCEFLANHELSGLENGQFAIISGGRICIKIDGYTTESDLKEAFGTNKLTLKVATPIPFILTPEDVNLDIGNNTLWTDGDTVDLIAVPVAKELPAVTSSDEGKVLTVDANGNWVAAESEATTALQQQY